MGMGVRVGRRRELGESSVVVVDAARQRSQPVVVLRALESDGRERTDATARTFLAFS